MLEYKRNAFRKEAESALDMLARNEPDTYARALEQAREMTEYEYLEVALHHLFKHFNTLLVIARRAGKRCNICPSSTKQCAHCLAEDMQIEEALRTIHNLNLMWLMYRRAHTH